MMLSEISATAEALSAAKGISEFGMLAVTAGFFLVLSAALMIVCFKWFKSIINDMLANYTKTTKDLLSETRKQNDMLNDISEGLRPETRLRIESTARVHFDLAVEKVCAIIKRVREENHIVDKDATTAKVRRLIYNLHDERDSIFDNYQYRGKHLSRYTDPQWIDWVQEAVISELYASSINENRTRTNIKSVYEKIKLAFYHNLNS